MEFIIQLIDEWSEHFAINVIKMYLTRLLRNTQAETRVIYRQT